MTPARSGGDGDGPGRALRTARQDRRRRDEHRLARPRPEAGTRGGDQAAALGRRGRSGAVAPLPPGSPHACGARWHENIVRIYDYVSSDEQSFLVMEYVAGKNLAQLTRGRLPLTPAEAAAYTTAGRAGARVRTRERRRSPRPDSVQHPDRTRKRRASSPRTSALRGSCAAPVRSRRRAYCSGHPSTGRPSSRWDAKAARPRTCTRSAAFSSCS